MDGYTREIIEHIAILSDDGHGKTKELNMVSENGEPPVLDLRRWYKRQFAIYGGITLTDEEAVNLLVALERIKG